MNESQLKQAKINTQPVVDFWASKIPLGIDGEPGKPLKGFENAVYMHDYHNEDLILIEYMLGSANNHCISN